MSNSLDVEAYSLAQPQYWHSRPAPTVEALLSFPTILNLSVQQRTPPPPPVVSTAPPVVAPPEDDNGTPNVPPEVPLGPGVTPVDTAARCENAFVSLDQAVDYMLDDIKKLNSNQRATTRYFTLTELWNAGYCDDMMEIARYGLAKAINSTLIEQGLVQLEPVDENETIFRVDLKDLSWDDDTTNDGNELVPQNNAADAVIDNKWDRITRDDFKGAAGDTLNGARSADLVFLPDTGSSSEDLIEEVSTDSVSNPDTVVPFISGMAFIGTALLRPLYNDLVEIPATLAGLEDRLGFNIFDNIQAEDVTRVAMQTSGVSDQNRILERHTGSNGWFWFSYDFADDACIDENDVTECKDMYRNPQKHDVANDGGEVVFQLENNLQGYMIFQGSARRVQFDEVRFQDLGLQIGDEIVRRRRKPWQEMLLRRFVSMRHLPSS